MAYEYDRDKERRLCEPPELEVRAESDEPVDKKKRYSQIIACLKETSPMTAKAIAVRMMLKGDIPTSERNFTSPRLTEMRQMGIVEQVGKVRCPYTGKTVSTFALTGNEN